MLKVALACNFVSARHHFAQHFGMVVGDPAAGEERGAVAGVGEQLQDRTGAAPQARLEALPVRARNQRAERTDLKVVLDDNGQEIGPWECAGRLA